MIKQIFTALTIGAFSLSTLAQSDGITVTGTVSREVTPDEMTIQFTISSLEDEVMDAYNETERKTNEVLAYVQTLGDDLCEAQTQYIRINENWQWNRQREVRELLGFNAVQSISISLKNFDLYPTVMTKLIELGVEDINNVRFNYTKAQELRNEMRAEAIEVAKAKGQEVADALGVVLGIPLMFTEQTPNSYFWEPMNYSSNVMYREADAGSSGPGIAPGTQTVEIAVVVRFAILAPTE